MESLPKLAELIFQRNAIDQEIGTILGRPVHSGHLGEYVAAAIFDIQLHPSATHKGSDGIFTDGPLGGKSVNIKFGTKQSGILDLVASTNPELHPDYYLVFTGSRTSAISSKGTHAPWNINYVYLFASRELLASLAERPVRIGVATSIRKHLWEAAEIYPECSNPRPALQLNPDQISALSLFSAMPT